MERHNGPDARLVELLEKQKRELVVRVLRKHEEVQAEKIFSDRVLASLSDLFFVTTADFRIVKANEEFRRLLGFAPEDDEELCLRSFASDNTVDRIRALLSEGEFRNFETEFTSRGGEKISVSLNGSTLAMEPGQIFHMLIARDVSDVHRMMSRIREAQEQLVHSERLASLGEMAAGIGHELTQPLNAVLLYARNCVKSLEGAEPNKALLAENLEIIIDRVRKASSIIKSLKSFARKEEPITYPVEVNPILANILRFLGAQLRLSDVEVEMDLAENIPPTPAHEVRLEQIFLNIIQNAIQSMGETESPRLVIKTSVERKMDPETMQEKDYVVTAIGDNGSGIQPEIQGKIFDPFFTTREVGTGMGLGLSIVARIVRSYAGFVKVESAPGRGTTFFIHLPACASEEESGESRKS